MGGVYARERDILTLMSTLFFMWGFMVTVIVRGSLVLQERAGVVCKNLGREVYSF